LNAISERLDRFLKMSNKRNEERRKEVQFEHAGKTEGGRNEKI
jgi:hypothetical protein